MTVPGTSVTNQWTDGEALDAALMHQRVDLPLIAAGGQAFRRTRTATFAVATSNTAIQSWPVLAYSAGTFGTYSGGGATAGQFTFTVPGLYRWTLPVAWPNGSAYKARAVLLINGSPSADGDNIDDISITTSGATAYTVAHVGEMLVAVGDVWQMALAASTAQTVIPQSWSVVKVA